MAKKPNDWIQSLDFVFVSLSKMLSSVAHAREMTRALLLGCFAKDTVSLKAPYWGKT